MDIEELVVIYKNDEIIGYNYFNISSYFNDLKLGINYHPSNELVSFINKKIKENNLEEIEIIEPNFRVGKVIECEDIEGTHLHLCKVDIKDEELQIVCGAANVSKDKLVVVALNDTMMMDGSVIRPGNLRGIASNGMCCSKRELGLTKDPARVGIILLDESYSVGEDFDFKG